MGKEETSGQTQTTYTWSVSQDDDDDDDDDRDEEEEEEDGHDVVSLKHTQVHCCALSPSYTHKSSEILQKSFIEHPLHQ